MCFIHFISSLFLFYCTFFVDDSLWVNGAPWKTKLDASGLFYFSCKLWSCFYFFFVGPVTIYIFDYLGFGCDLLMTLFVCGCLCVCICFMCTHLVIVVK
jgi:hypothetical protein